MIKAGIFKRNISIFKELLIIALPLMLANLLHTIYNLTDAFFLGKLGKEELSAPTIAFNIIFFLIIFGMGLSMSGTTLIAQSKGKGDKKKINFYLGQMTFVLLAVSIILGIIGIISAEILLKLLQTPAEVFKFTYDYMILIICGLPLIFGYFIFQGSFQGIGDTVTPLKIQAVTVLINVILDPFLIFGWWIFPSLGVKGAAIATLIARFIAIAIAFYILIKGSKGLKLKFKNILPDKKSIIVLLKIGLPTAFGNAISALGFTVLQGIVNIFGTSVIAAFGVGNRIIALYNMPAMGISRATTTLVGHNIGAKNIKKTKKVIKLSLLTILSFLIPATTLTFFWGSYFIKFFVNDPETIAWGSILFKIVSPSVIFFGLFTVINGALQGAGDTKPILFLSIIRLWVIRVPLAFLLSIVLCMGPVGIWISMFISNISVAVLGLIWLKMGKWIYAVDVDKI